MQQSAATKPLYATCPHCKETVQCYRNGQVRLSAHHGKGTLENCLGSNEVAISPREER